jgi:VIT1/CCC1 family predicted Fe2+/Mn2+ transporter
MEERHIDQIPQGEQQEIRQIYQAKGFDGDLLERIVEVITNDRQRWINTMLTEEWGLQLQPPSPWRSGASTFVAFILAGLIPLAPALLSPAKQASTTFVISSLLTGVAFFGIGLIRGLVVEDRPLIAGLETLLIGGTAASVAYVVGLMLQGIAG